MAKFKVLLTMTETAVLEFEAATEEEAIQMARDTRDVDFDLEGCEYGIVDEASQ